MIAPSTFALPDLRDVPRSWSVSRPQSRAARIALALLDAGIISPGLRQPWHPARVLYHGLAGWLAREMHPCAWLRLQIDYTEAAVRFGPPDFELTSFLSLGPAYTACVHLRPLLAPIEQATPRLGQSVLEALARASRAGLPLILPQTVFHMASWLYWGGSDDERNMREEMGEEGEDYIGITRAELDVAIPRWAQQPRPLSRKALATLAAGRSRTRPLARAILHLHAVVEANRRAVELLGPDYTDTACWALWLRWAPDDPAGRILDDYTEQQFHTGEYSENFSSVEIVERDFADGTADRELRRFFAGIAPALRIAAAVEALLRAAGVRDAR